ncbi:protein translocase subunit SecD [Candidatus Gracilibacteria bacterium]|nr:protein translocase subunit SecD [Candidatus Gracilibacteria bacterium]
MTKRNLLLRLTLICVLSLGAFVYIFPWKAFDINFVDIHDYKLGLDLQGGIELDYKVILDEAKKASDYDKQKEKSIIEGLKSIIDKRVEKLKINDSVITSASYAGEQHIIVQIPLKGNNTFENEENIKKAKETIGKVVKIEFKEKRKNVTDADKKERKDLARTIIAELKTTKDGFNPIAQQYKDNYENVDFGSFSGTREELNSFFNIDYINLKKGLFNDIVSGTGKSSITVEDGQLAQKSGEAGYYVLNYLGETKVSSTGSTSTGSTQSGTGKVSTVYSFDYVFLTKSPSEWMSAKDKKGRILNDKYFVKAGVATNDLFQPMVELTFNTEGAEIFGELTSRLTGEQIAIFVGGHLLTAPRVNEPILTGKAVITGDYTTEEAKSLSQDINTGVVPAPIYLTSERTIDSKLGFNSLNKLLASGIVGFVFILLFLVYIYRASGLMASLALLVYVILLLFIVKFFQTVLTLASIAGLILSIGMAIDANILIFERTKDELRDGKNLDEALQIGFKKSFSAIFDTHITGLLTALILFIFGINMIKGFGLMLGIGLIVSLFTVLYISKIFIVLLSKTKINEKYFIGKL